MTAPQRTLADLPRPPAGRTGWPWTEAPAPFPATAPDGSPWPRLSIVTSSFNQGRFIEETLRSVLLQGYPNLEYLVVDGGSTDESVAIIRKYEQWLTYWTSEPDRGQADAINKGFARATGSLLGWVNSDDLLLPRALRTLAEVHRHESRAILVGDVFLFSDETRRGTWLRPHDVTVENILAPWRRGWSLHQAGTFVSAPAAAQVGPLDDGLRYVFDYDWLCRMLLAGTPLVYLERGVTAFRLHARSKSTGETPRWSTEMLAVLARYRGEVRGLSTRRLAAGHHVHMASVRLSLFHIDWWNRRAALAHLSRAATLAPLLLLSPSFWHVAARLAIPRSARERWREWRFRTPLGDALRPGRPPAS